LRRRNIPKDVVEFLADEIAYKCINDWSETWFYHTIMRQHGERVEEGM